MTLSFVKDSSYEAEKGEFILKKVRYLQKIMAAEDAVKFIVGMKFYGPEATLSADGAADYKSKQAMTRQEAAALLYLASKWSLVP